MFPKGTVWHASSLRDLRAVLGVRAGTDYMEEQHPVLLSEGYSHIYFSHPTENKAVKP